MRRFISITLAVLVFGIAAILVAGKLTVGSSRPQAPASKDASSSASQLKLPGPWKSYREQVLGTTSRKASIADAETDLAFKIRAPQTLGTSPLVAIAVDDVRTTPDGKVVAQRPVGDRGLYLFYRDNDLGLWEATAPSGMTTATFVASYTGSTGDSAYRVHTAVAGHDAVEWSKGTYTYRDSDGTGTVQATGSVVYWLQDGILYSVQSTVLTGDQLLPLAAQASTTAEQ